MKTKLKKFIGQAIVIIIFHAMWIGMFVYGFMTATTLR